MSILPINDGVNDFADALLKEGTSGHVILD